MGLTEFLIVLAVLHPKVAEKYIGTIAKAFPATFGPLLKVLNSYAEAHAIKTRTAAETHALVSRVEAFREKNLSEADIALLKMIDATPDGVVAMLETRDPVLAFSQADASRKLTNRLQIASQAAQHLGEEVTTGPVDEDFIHHFFRSSEDVSNATMQSLWAKLLAGEISRPGSFSPRTLEVLRATSQREAQNFTKFCSMVWQIKNELYVVRHDQTRIHTLSEAVGLSLRDLRQLEYAGLVHLHTLLHVEINAGDHLKYFDRFDYVACAHGTIPTSPLTIVGEELFPLSGAKPNDRYAEISTKYLERFLPRMPPDVRG